MGNFETFDLIIQGVPKGWTHQKNDTSQSVFFH